MNFTLSNQGSAYQESIHLLRRGPRVIVAIKEEGHDWVVQFQGLCELGRKAGVEPNNACTVHCVGPLHSMTLRRCASQEQMLLLSVQGCRARLTKQAIGVVWVRVQQLNDAASTKAVAYCSQPCGVHNVIHSTQLHGTACVTPAGGPGLTHRLLRMHSAGSGAAGRRSKGGRAAPDKPSAQCHACSL